MARYYVRVTDPKTKAVQYAFRDSRWEAKYVAKQARSMGRRAEVYKLLKIWRS